VLLKLFMTIYSIKGVTISSFFLTNWSKTKQQKKTIMDWE